MHACGDKLGYGDRTKSSLNIEKSWQLKVDYILQTLAKFLINSKIIFCFFFSQLQLSTIAISCACVTLYK